MKQTELKSKSGQEIDTSSDVRYLYADPTASTMNYGDLIIDRAVRHMLTPAFGKPTATCDLRSGNIPEGDFDLVLVPGVTVLRDQGRVRETLRKMPWPKFCLSGSYWSPLPKSGILLRNRVIAKGSVPRPELDTVKLLNSPVGVRDPFTASLLAKENIPCRYVGCPTLHLPADGVSDNGYVLFSLGRGHARTQTFAARKISKSRHVIGICHEDGDYERFRAAGWNLPLITYNGDLDIYLSYFKNATVVVTGRLHGALPSLVYGKAVYYFGTRDSRTTILDDLGVPIHGYGRLSQSVTRASNGFNRYLLGHFRKAWKNLMQSVIAQTARSSTSSIS
jgi:hypothetical protein